MHQKPSVDCKADETLKSCVEGYLESRTFEVKLHKIMFRFTKFWEKIIVIIEAFWEEALTIIAEALSAAGERADAGSGAMAAR